MAIYNLTEQYGLKVKRDVSVSNGKEYNNYRVYAKLRGREYGAEFIPAVKNSNINSFDTVNIAFDEHGYASLVREVKEQVDSNNNKRENITYTVQTVVDGVVYSAVVRPRTQTDVDLLNMAIRVAEAKKKAEQAEAAPVKNVEQAEAVPVKAANKK